MSGYGLVLGLVMAVSGIVVLISLLPTYTVTIDTYLPYFEPIAGVFYMYTPAIMLFGIVTSVLFFASRMVPR